MVKVISRDFIEINPGEIIEEVVLSERVFFFNYKVTLRKVHGTIFRYKKGRYETLCFFDRGYRDVFNLPVDEN
jgi:hypothetical protein